MLASGNVHKPYISFSSDDGVLNNMEAASVFNEFGIKCCFFICPGMVGEKRYDKIREFCATRLHLPPVEFLDWTDVDELLRQGHEIGGHTSHHVDLGAVDQNLANDEIFSCKEELDRRCGSALHFAFPYGRFHNFPSTLRAAVHEAGFLSNASAERGCHVIGPEGIRLEDLLVRRDHVILDWPVEHIRYFLIKNARRKSVRGNNYPV
jgi:peptidoglycan/xylan/chitin deacetylase (PgdA/CDA1 family)